MLEPEALTLRHFLVHTVAHELLNVDGTLVPRHKVEPWPLITLRPRFGMPMIIERRTA